jgi:hypothetical protein
MKNVSKKSIASQGKGRSQLTNFSYIFGANYMEKQIKKDAPAGFQVPEQFRDFKPHPEYMDRSAPLRQALDAQILVLLSPSKAVFMDGFGVSEEARPFVEKTIASRGGFENMLMGMMVHEMFHTKQGEDQVNGLALGRKINEDRKELGRQLQADARLRSLLVTYVKIVFSLGDSLKKSNASSAELVQLSDLQVIIGELKSKYPEAWKFVWNYEYTEGFAEYVSAYSMIQVGVTSFQQKIDLEKNDRSNNFAYRTGALGGLYVMKRLQQMPFGRDEDHHESIWEIILRLADITTSEPTLDRVILKYSRVLGVDADEEIKLVRDYLVSTVLEVQ